MISPPGVVSTMAVGESSDSCGHQRPSRQVLSAWTASDEVAASYGTRRSANVSVASSVEIHTIRWTVVSRVPSALYVMYRPSRRKIASVVARS
jgi:hypothetical protein